MEPKTTTIAANHRSPLAVLLDDADYLRDQIEAYGVEALLDRISDDEMPALRALHELLSRVAPSPATPKPQPKQSQPRPSQGAETLSDDMARELRSVIDAMRDVPTDEDMLVAVLAKQTGLSPDAIREEIRSTV